MNRVLIRAALALFALCAGPGMAEPLPPAALERMRAADIVILGEVHDNPAHHAVQAQALADLALTGSSDLPIDFLRVRPHG